MSVQRHLYLVLNFEVITMKMKIIAVIAALMVFGLSLAAVAHTRTTGAASMAASCCKGDSCPMKSKTESAGEKASCCDDCDSCSGDSCPMKMGEASATGMKMADGKYCPMMKSEKASTAHTQIKYETTAGEAKNCDCSCCNHDKEKIVTSGV